MEMEHLDLKCAACTGHARVLATYAESPIEMRPELVLDAVRYLLAHPLDMADEIRRQHRLLEDA